MFHELVGLDATEKDDILAALIRYRGLAAELRERGPSTSLTTSRWQTSAPSMQHAGLHPVPKTPS
jgi:hypothetical protein